MFTSVALAVFIGGFLAIVTNMGAALVFRLPWYRQGRRSIPPTDFRTREFLVGWCALAGAYLLSTGNPGTLGIYATPVMAAIYAVAGLWSASALWHLGRYIGADRYIAELGPGDPDYDYAMALARRNGIQVKAVRTVARVSDIGSLARRGIIALTVSERTLLSETDRQVRLAEWVGSIHFVKMKPVQIVRAGLMVLAFGTTVLVVSQFLPSSESSTFMFLIQASMAGFAYFASIGNAKKRIEIDKFILNIFPDYFFVSDSLTRNFELAAALPNSLSSPKTLEARQERLLKAAKELGL